MRDIKQKELLSYIEEVKTIDKEYRPEPFKKIGIADNNRKFITTETYSCHLNNGKTISRDKITKNMQDGNASIILPITTDNTTILTIQPRVFTKSTVGISLPAGYLEYPESYIAAARRELLEETGYVSDSIREVCQFYQDDGCSAAFNKGFIAEDCVKVGAQKLDESEYIKCFECTIDELLELYEKGYILDVGSQFVIEKSKEFLKKRG